MLKVINVRIKGLNLKISVNKNIEGKKYIRYFNETFVVINDLSLYLHNFIENEYLTKLDK